MFWLVRMGAYVLSGLTVWQFFDSGTTDNLMLTKQLAIDSSHSMVFGVCSGISKYTGIDVTLIRFAWTLTCLYRGIGVALYILAFLIMPAY
ncbi:PspC domain-containing protein [Dendrosporobacter sp. 1207_IL3150]|uniref:PspC domain-containing protein n=1 Tax=Dendrosporobacter sp. 1207_IL3150 TaxID=3084054 RepID=UPI002FDB2ED9